MKSLAVSTLNNSNFFSVFFFGSLRMHFHKENNVSSIKIQIYGHSSLKCLDEIHVARTINQEI